MVDPLGVKPVQTSERIAPVTRVVPTTAATPVAAPQTEAASQSALVATAKEFAAKPPVDLDRVARIRKAIADGNFPIYPATVADRLIALKLEWSPNEAGHDAA